MIQTSWLAKVGQQWRWTPLDRAYLYHLAMRLPAWQVMALWDCYIKRPWHECRAVHFCQPEILDWLRDDPDFKTLEAIYSKRLLSKSNRRIRGML